MSDKTGIEWTDATWNPVTGCTKVSPGCDHCYAETFAERWRGVAGHAYERGFDLTLRPERLDQPLRWTRPRRIFVNSMSDLFHDGVPDEYIAAVFATMARARQHTFQVLTKRPGRLRSLLTGDLYDLVVRELSTAESPPAGLTWPLPNVWLGVSVETQKWADVRVLSLLATPAAVRFVSCEPLLGPVDLRDCAGVDALEQDWTGGPGGGMGAPHPLLDWVIVGGESGRGARPMHPDWACSLRDQCTQAGVAFHFKQHGEWAALGPLYAQGDTEDDHDEMDEAHWDAVAYTVENKTVVELESTGHVVDGYQATDPRTWLMVRLGKRKAGRKLDGRTWDEYPTAAT